MIAKLLRVVVSALFVYWFAGLLLGWSFQPEPVVLETKLSSETEELLDGAPALQAQVKGALDQLVGTPSAPGYLRIGDWIDEGWDPSRPDQPWPEDADYDALGLTDFVDVFGFEAPGSGELDGATFAEIVRGNEYRHADALAAIDAAAAGEDGASWDDVRFPAWYGELADSFAYYLEQHEAGEYPAIVDFASDMKAMIRTWYPRLSESAELYRRQCLHCHGNEGGGDGPTAEFLLPRPRDYRKGIFKFTAVSDKARPRREDLYKVLHDGLYLTAMPSFARFEPGELHGLVDYVRLLAIRGETEGLLALDGYDNFFELPIENVQDNYVTVWGNWNSADDHFVSWDGPVPEATDEMIDAGRRYYREKNDLGEHVYDCATCHGIDGRGGGGSSYEDVDVAPGADLDTYGIAVDLSGAADGVVVVNGHRYEFDASGDAGVQVDLDPAVEGQTEADAAADGYYPITVEYMNDQIGLNRLNLTPSDDGWELVGVNVKRAKLDDWGDPIFARDFTRGVFRAGRRPIDVYRRIYSGINGSPMPAHDNYDPDVLWALVHYVRWMGSSDAQGSADFAPIDTDSGGGN